VWRSASPSRRGPFSQAGAEVRTEGEREETRISSYHARAVRAFGAAIDIAGDQLRVVLGLRGHAAGGGHEGKTLR
jgi:hypothetical protein